MFQLNNLTPLTKKRKRIGRGGSRGGTAGRGNKGQKSRSGHARGPIAFEGGQMPLVRRLPKRGFNNKNFETTFAVINIEQLEKHFESGARVDKDALQQKGLIKNNETKIKLLGNGSLSKKLIIHVDACSTHAREAVQQCGGEVQLIKEM